MIDRVAIHDHRPNGPNQIELRVGDQIGTRGAGDFKDADIFKGPNKRTGNLWNGWSVGVDEEGRVVPHFQNRRKFSNHGVSKVS